LKVLIADRFEQSGIDGLEKAGCDVSYQPDLKDTALADVIRETRADILVVRGTPVTAAMLEGGALSLVVRAGAGYNTIDVAAASRQGIYVSNCPGQNAIAVAELAFGLILALDRRIPDNVSDLKAGRWNKKEYSKARGLFGRTLGLIGYGNIGQEMARRAHGFGMRTIVWSRRFATGAATDVEASSRRTDLAGVPAQIAASPQALAEQADILSVHVALTAATRGIVDGSILDRLKRGAYLINTARAELVDPSALERAVRERGVRLGIDVFANEPTAATGAFSDAIVQLPNVYGTHHIGGSTDQAQDAIAAETVRVIVTYKNTGKVPNVVNLAKRTPATHMLVVRHRDRPGVLAHVFDRLRSGLINVQETENVVFEGAEAAVARINLDQAPSDALLQAIRAGSGDILDVHVIAIEVDNDRS
jgi:D-3-phosphoglycerate dehydrogenase / 2-oxoglutarate reductase